MLLPVVCCLVLSGAQGVAVPPLTADEQRALGCITENRVRAAVSFLASDELEGRDTGSTGLRIASAYVAARFRGAGLVGLGEERRYYLDAEQRIVPGTGVVLRAGNADIVQHGLLVAPSTTLQFEGKVAFAAKPRQGAFAGPILIDDPSREGEAVGRSAMRVINATRAAKKNGATALLIRVATESNLRRLAAKVQGKNDAGRTGAFLAAQAELPVLLVQHSLAPNQELTLELPAVRLGASKHHNVAGILRGSDPKLAAEALLITAHLDHIGVRRRGKDRINNGADDDASGVTGVLALADAFAALKVRPKRSVIFMTFWGEERGLLGSKDFAAHPAWPLAKIVANVNLEMIGRPEQGARFKTWMTGWTKSDLGELVARGAKRVGVEVFRHRRFSPMLYGASDNASFVHKGVIAHSFSAGSLHKDYHQPSDEWEKLDLEHMTKVIQGLFAGCLPIANGVLTPTAKARR